MVSVDAASVGLGAGLTILLGILAFVYVNYRRRTDKKNYFTPSQLKDCHLPNEANDRRFPGRKAFVLKESKRVEVSNAFCKKWQAKWDEYDAQEKQLESDFKELTPKITAAANELRNADSMGDKKTFLTSTFIPLIHKRNEFNTRLHRILYSKNVFFNHQEFWSAVGSHSQKMDVVDHFRNEIEIPTPDLSVWLQERSLNPDVIDEVLAEWSAEIP